MWESDPWPGSAGIDSCAVISTAIVDTEGDLYVSDCDQVWAYHADGQVKWVTPLPVAPENSPLADNPLHPNNFVTAVFTPDGKVVGVTLFGQVVALDRDSGELVFEPFLLPSVPSTVSTDPPLPPTTWSGVEMDPLSIDTMWQIIFGGTVVSANTPAVSAETGRVFVVAGGSDPDSGVLYGFDIDAKDTPSVDIAFSTPVGVGSGCSPSLSPDNTTVYTCDAAGTLYSVAADSGDINWTADAKSEAGSVAVGPEGTIYVLIEKWQHFVEHESGGAETNRKLCVDEKLHQVRGRTTWRAPAVSAPWYSRDQDVVRRTKLIPGEEFDESRKTARVARIRLERRDHAPWSREKDARPCRIVEQVDSTCRPLSNFNAKPSKPTSKMPARDRLAGTRDDWNSAVVEREQGAEDAGIDDNRTSGAVDGNMYSSRESQKLKAFVRHANAS